MNRSGREAHPFIQVTKFAAQPSGNHAQPGTREEFLKFRPAENVSVKVSAFGFEPVQPFTFSALLRSYDVDQGNTAIVAARMVSFA